MTRMFFLLLSFIFMTIGFTYMIIYMNLLTFGYTIKEYFLFLFQRIEWYFLPLGLGIEILCLQKKGTKK